jgi:hypothetical protein
MEYAIFRPEDYPPHTDLLNLQPLPISALHDEVLEICAKRFSHFNPVQTQIFHMLYHTEHNALVGAPTGTLIFILLKASPCVCSH